MQRLPIGNDDFTEIRENCLYFVDKSLLIRDFLDIRDKVALIARPRRFGKTLNMTMLRDFLDITKDSRDLFRGLAIMDTDYAVWINSRPVIWMKLKDCKGRSAKELIIQLKSILLEEFARHESCFQNSGETGGFRMKQFCKTYYNLQKEEDNPAEISRALYDLSQMLYEYYHKEVILLIDEYDQPVMSSYEYAYHDELGSFFSNFFGSALKGNPAVSQALLTGVQRVAKESIFSQFNNAQVYSVTNPVYAQYFGLTEKETGDLLADYGLELNEEVKKQYDGYCIGGVEIYNPWSILNYARSGFLDNYWVNTSANTLVCRALEKADSHFWDDFDVLASGKSVEVWITLETSYLERDSNYSLWGLLVNAGYLTVTRRVDANTAVVRIPNREVLSEFQMLIAEISGVDGLELKRMFLSLQKKQMEQFFKIYQKIVISCTSYMDAKENAYHMLFLGMCMALNGLYKVTSNLESEYGRSDITLESLSRSHPNMIVEFKQGEDLESLKKEALQQILEQKYFTGLSGEVICVGLAHNKKRCAMEYCILQL